ncbi:29923_t:CDS:1, partial [Racocetra persica]
ESSHENEKHIDNSKGKQLKKRKLESVHKYLDELNDELEAS